MASMFGNSNGSGVADMSAGSNPFLEPTTGGTSGEAFKKVTIKLIVIRAD